ncbi:MAG: helix-turn-helix domain-containing protein [Alphaproteobacteria bacterium]|nr:helix-turn-helix domain-containing protein [Alphaproteobacteria bacterium]
MDDIAADERFDHWRDSLDLTSARPVRPMRNVEMRASRWAGRLPSGVAFWRNETTFAHPVEMERTRERCRRDGADVYFLCIPLQTMERVVQKDSACAVKPGQAFLFDAGRPWLVTSSALHYFNIDLPRDLVDKALGDGTERCASRLLTIDRGTDHLLRCHADGLAQCGGKLPPAALETALGFLHDIAIEILCRQVETESSRSDRRLLAAAKRLIAKRLDDSNLGVDSVVEALGVSRATLYRAFKGEAEGIAASIASARLERARDLLARGDVRPVARVAFACGYDSLSTFNRLFRQRFGCTPSEARAARRRPG